MKDSNIIPSISQNLLITDELHDSGCRVNRKKLGRDHEKDGYSSHLPKPNTSKKHPENEVYYQILTTV